MKTISEYVPLIWGKIADRQARRMACEARVQRAVNTAVERVMLPVIGLFFALLVVAVFGEGVLFLIHYLAP